MVCFRYISVNTLHKGDNDDDDDDDDDNYTAQLATHGPRICVIVRCSPHKLKPKSSHNSTHRFKTTKLLRTLNFFYICLHAQTSIRCVMGQVINRWSVIAEVQLKPHTNVCGICGELSGNETRFPESTSAFVCQYHSTSAPYLVSNILPTPHNVGNWQRR
jgi:hypothetical protein